MAPSLTKSFFSPRAVVMFLVVVCLFFLGLFGSFGDSFCLISTSTARPVTKRQQPPRRPRPLLFVSKRPPSPLSRTTRRTSSSSSSSSSAVHLLRASLDDDDHSNNNNSSSDSTPTRIVSATATTTPDRTIWRPRLRRIMAGIATLGVLETGYLTYNKLYGGTATSLPFCGTDDTSGSIGSCSSVLTGPYSTLPYVGVPISALGLVAYATVWVLALTPLVSFVSRRTDDGENENDNRFDNDDTSNRILLTSMTTAMGTFSIFLVTVLLGVLHTPCPYCLFSAFCSLTLAQLTWLGGCLPSESKHSFTNNNETQDEESVPSLADWGNRAVGTSVVATTIGALLFFVSVNVEQFSTSSQSGFFGSGGSGGGGGDASTLSGTLLASSSASAAVAGSSSTKLLTPPSITTESSERALRLATRLESLDARMYGAYWCSHCYDQKQLLGQQAFSKLTYVECSKDGLYSQSKLCRSKDIPGYPTWEIQGKLYPGQQELDELEELVETVDVTKQ